MATPRQHLDSIASLVAQLQAKSETNEHAFNLCVDERELREADMMLLGLLDSIDEEIASE
jgi:hypothetical protein